MPHCLIHLTPFGACLFAWLRGWAALWSCRWRCLFAWTDFGPSRHGALSTYQLGLGGKATPSISGEAGRARAGMGLIFMLIGCSLPSPTQQGKFPSLGFPFSASSYNVACCRWIHSGFICWSLFLTLSSSVPLSSVWSSCSLVWRCMVVAGSSTVLDSVTTVVPRLSRRCTGGAALHPLLPPD